MRAKKLMTGIFGGSLVLLITINLFNALNYFFHFVMARMLQAELYGTLAALMAITYIFNVPMESMQTIITKYTSQEESPGKIKNILRRALKKSIKISFFLFLIYLAVVFFLADFLKIKYSLLALTGLLIFAVFLIPINRGALQGKKRFTSLGLNMILEAVVKFLLAIFLVYIGWKVYGAMLAVFLGSVIAFIFAFFSLKDIFKAKEVKSDTKEIYGYSMPIFVIIFSIMAFYSLDLILAKALFSAEVAGQYAIASMLAKIILFGTLPISRAMFPISAEAHKNKDTKEKSIFGKALIIMGIAIGVALLVMGIFPELMVRIFAGDYYPAASGILFNLAIVMTLLSFTNLILFHKISVGKTKNYWLTPLFLVAEVLLLWRFSSNLFEYSITLIFLSMLFLFGSVFLLKAKEE